MKYVAILTVLGLGSAAIIAVGAPEGRGGHQGAERLKQADTNGDGLISRAEAAALPRLGKHFDQIDINRDGNVSADEMRAFHEKRRAEHWKKRDTNGDGRISRDEAQAGSPRLAERFDQVDANKDGFVTPEEMKAAHGKQRAPK